MNLTVQQVPQQYCAQVWPQVKDFIADALKHGGGDYDIGQAQLMVNMGQWVLFVVVDEEKKIHGAATSSFINYPNDRVAFITTIGGKLISNKITFAQLSDQLKQLGATKIQGLARPSIARLWKRYGFNERSILVETKL